MKAMTMFMNEDLDEFVKVPVGYRGLERQLQLFVAKLVLRERRKKGSGGQLQNLNQLSDYSKLHASVIAHVALEFGKCVNRSCHAVAQDGEAWNSSNRTFLTGVSEIPAELLTFLLLLQNF